MIELFSRRVNGIILPPDAVVTPLPIDDDISSLSAILLDDAYYDFLRIGVMLLNGVPILDAAHLIPFKAKAWLELTERKANGGQVDSRNIRKHKNDIVRLSTLFLANDRLSLPETIMQDMREFFSKVDEPENYIRAALVYGLSDAIPLDKLPMKQRMEEAKRRADEYNANRLVNRHSEHERDIEL